MVTYLLSLPNTPLSCGIPVHPGPDTKYWNSITKPSLWLLASHDVRFTDKYVAQLRQTFEAKQKDGVEFDHHIYPGLFAVQTKEPG